MSGGIRGGRERESVGKTLVAMGVAWGTVDLVNHAAHNKHEYKFKNFYTMPFPTNQLLTAFAALLIPVNAHAAMCTGVIVNSPVRTLHSGVSSYYKTGDKQLYITQRRAVNGTYYYCSWGGDCINSGDVRLHRVMAVKGDPSKMNGIETKMKSYETLEVCTPSSLDTTRD